METLCEIEESNTANRIITDECGNAYIFDPETNSYCKAKPYIKFAKGDEVDKQTNDSLMKKYGKWQGSDTNINNEHAHEEIIGPPGEEKMSYPAIGEKTMSFLNNVVWINLPEERRKIKVSLPQDELMHRIYDLTEGWDPSSKESAHKWRILYETLVDLEYITINERPKLKKFVEAVVTYCYPGVHDNYENNLSKIKLSEHKETWTQDNKALLKHIKEELKKEKLLPRNS